MKPLECLRALIAAEWLIRIPTAFGRRDLIADLNWLPILAIALFVTGTVVMFTGKRFGTYLYLGAYLIALKYRELFTNDSVILETASWFLFGAILYLAFTVLKPLEKRV